MQRRYRVLRPRRPRRLPVPPAPVAPYQPAGRVAITPAEANAACVTVTRA